MKRILLLVIIWLLTASRVFSQSDICDSLRDQTIKTWQDREALGNTENISIFENILQDVVYHEDCYQLYATLYRALAVFYRDEGLYTKSDNLYNQALLQDSLNQDSIGLAKTFCMKTALEEFKNAPVAGILYSDKAIEILNLIELDPLVKKAILDATLINRANCLRNLKRYSEASNIYRTYLDTTSNWQKEALQGLGDIAFDQQLFPKALEYYQNLLPFYGDDLKSQAHLEHSIGRAHLELGDTLNAKNSFVRSARNAKLHSSYLMQSYALLDLIRLPNHFLAADSIAFYQEALLRLSQREIGSQTDEEEQIIEMVQDLLEEEDGSKAYFLMDAFMEYREDKNEAKKNNFYRLYNLAGEQENKKQRARLIQIFSLVLAAILGFLFLLRRMELNKLAAETEKQILREQHALQALNHAEDLLKTEFDLREELAEQAHDLKGDIAGVSNQLAAQTDFDTDKNLGLEKLQVIAQDVSVVFKKLRNLSRKLDPDPDEWLYTLQSMLRQIEEDTAIETIINIDSLLHIPIGTYVGYRIQTILRVLFENVKEHAKANQLRVTGTYTEEHVIVEIIDNGIGGFNYPEDAGVGLKSVMKKVTEIGGELVITSSKGTEVKLKIPRQETSK